MKSNHERRIGNWEIQKFLGHGNSMDAYLVNSYGVPLNTATLLVVRGDMNNEEAERTSRRINDSLDVMVQLDHENFGKIIDVGRFGHYGRTFYVREYGEETLDHIMNKEGQMDFNSATRLIVGYLNGLAYIHEKGFVHRDIKPGNLMVYDGRPLITDLEIYNVVKDDITLSGSTTKESKKEILTPEFGSPEQLRMINAEIDHRTDLYSLTKVYYKMLAGKMPQQEERLIDVRKDLPKRVHKVITKGLQNNPEKRYQSAEDMKKDIEYLMGQTHRRRSYSLSGCAVLALGGLIALGVAFDTLAFNGNIIKKIIPDKKIERIVEEKPKDQFGNYKDQFRDYINHIDTYLLSGEKKELIQYPDVVDDKKPEEPKEFKIPDGLVDRKEPEEPKEFKIPGNLVNREKPEEKSTKDYLREAAEGFMLK